jgi:hypothetical protein
MSYELERLRKRLVKATARVETIKRKIRARQEREDRPRTYVKIGTRASNGWRGEISRS